MIDDNVGDDERILDQFRTWLQQTRQQSDEQAEPDAASAAGVVNDVAPPLPVFGLERLVEEFTALRHELKLQTRSSRSLEELVEASLTSLADAASTFRSASAQEVSRGAETSDKQFASALAELDEALERGREQWKKNSERLIGPSAPISLTQLNELYERQSWWRRWRMAAYHRRLCHAVEHAEKQARHDRQALLTALLSGQDLIQQRLTRTMASVGVVRIPTVGRLVDPELMVVVEVIDGTGPAGQVVDEVRRGYLWKGGLLRPAEVRAIRPRYDQESP